MAFLLLLPSLALVAAVFLWPLLRYGWLSLQASSVLTGLAAVPNGGANWQRLLADAQRAQPLGARALEKLQVVGIEHDATGVGVFPVHADVKSVAHGM